MSGKDLSGGGFAESRQDMMVKCLRMVEIKEIMDCSVILNSQYFLNVPTYHVCIGIKLYIVPGHLIRVEVPGISL